MRTIRLVPFLLLAVSAGGVLAVAVSTGAQTPAASEEAAASEYLFVQQAAGGTIAPADDGAWTLTLTGVFPQTVYFTDRPVRQAGAIPTAELLVLDDLFTADNPPNAAIVLADIASERDDVLVVELLAPAYDPTAGTLRYTVTPVEWNNQADPFWPGEFGHVTLFIDGTLDDPTDPTDSYQFCLGPPPLFCF
jgi:hypothetical protein